MVKYFENAKIPQKVINLKLMKNMPKRMTLYYSFCTRPLSVLYFSRWLSPTMS